MSRQGDLVASTENTLHQSTGEIIYYETGERTKMRCGVTLAGVGHPYNRYMVEDWDGKVCPRCFTDDAEPRNAGGSGE